MDVAKSYRPISYLKSNTADVAKEIMETSAAVVITQNGIPSFVCVSMEEYYQTQETNALVKLVSLGRRDIEQGRFRSLDEATRSLDETILGGADQKK